MKPHGQGCTRRAWWIAKSHCVPTTEIAELRSLATSNYMQGACREKGIAKGLGMSITSLIAPGFPEQMTVAMAPLRTGMHRAVAASRDPKTARPNGVAWTLASARGLGLNWPACPMASSPPAPPRERARCGRTTREPGSGDAVRDERARLPPLTRPRGHRHGAPAPHRGGASPARATGTTPAPSRA